MNDTHRPESTWRRIALWQIGGLALTTIILGVFSIARLALSHSGLAIQVWPSIFLGNSFWVLSAGVFMLPITVAALFAWTKCARRFPQIEQGYAALVPALAVVALLISFVVGAVNNWEVALGQVQGDFFREAIRGIGYVYIPVLLGLVVPRVVVPALRPGAFMEELRAAAV